MALLQRAHVFSFSTLSPWESPKQVQQGCYLARSPLKTSKRPYLPLQARPSFSTSVDKDTQSKVLLVRKCPVLGSTEPLYRRRQGQWRAQARGDEKDGGHGHQDGSEHHKDAELPENDHKKSSEESTGSSEQGTQQEEGADKGSERQSRQNLPGPFRVFQLFQKLQKEKRRTARLQKELEEARQSLEGGKDDAQRPAGPASEKMEKYLRGDPEVTQVAPKLGTKVAQAANTVIFGKKAPTVSSKPLDLDKLRKCFSFTTFFATDSVRYGSGGLFPGNMRGEIAEVVPKLEKKLAEAAGTDVIVFFLMDDTSSRQVCIVQPKADFESRANSTRLGGLSRYPLAIALLLTTLFTTTFLAGVNLDPSRTIPELVDHAVPLVGGLGIILGTSELCQRYMAAKHGVQLSPPYLLPSGWLGCLGIATQIESLLPNRGALFDIAAARGVGGWLASFTLAATAFAMDGGSNGGSNPIYVEPSFFQPNVLLSFIQYVIGPYADELGNVLPHAVPDLGVPVDPLAFAGLLGMVITSLNLMPTGRLEGGRIAQALFGRRLAQRVSFCTNVILGVGGLGGSVICLAWGFIVLFFRGGEEMPAKDEITSPGLSRYVLGWFLLGLCLLTLLPNSAGTFPSTFFTPSFFLRDAP